MIFIARHQIIQQVRFFEFIIPPMPQKCPFLPLRKICNAFDMTMAQFLAADDYTELTKQQLELLKKWELLTPQQKDALFDLICAII